MAEIVIRVSESAQRIAGICLGGIVLVSAFLGLWSPGVFLPKYQLRVYAPDASGLRVKTQVRLDGVPVGSVSAINVAGESSSPERRIEVGLRIDKRFQRAIRSDWTATVMIDGLLGEPYLNIQRGFNGSVVASGGEIRFVPTHELRIKDFPAAVEKMANCIQTAKDASGSKDQTVSDTPAKTKS